MDMSDIQVGKRYHGAWGGFPVVEVLETGIERVRFGKSMQDGVRCLVLAVNPRTTEHLSVGQEVLLSHQHIHRPLED